MSDLNIPLYPEGYIVFLIAGDKYGINVKNLQKIIHPFKDLIKEITKIANDSIIINNEEIHLADLYQLFNKKSVPVNEETRIIEISDLDKKLAFYVEKVKELVFPRKIDSLREEFDPGLHKYYTFRVSYSNGTFLLLDIDKIFAAGIQSS